MCDDVGDGDNGNNDAGNNADEGDGGDAGGEGGEKKMGAKKWKRSHKSKRVLFYIS